MAAPETMAELVLAAQDGTGESPVWDDQAGTLWWTDIPGRRLHVLDAAGAERVFPTPGRVGSFALRRDGGLVLGMENGLAFWDPPAGDPALIAEPERGLVEHRFNDGRCDRQGRFLAGSMNMHHAGEPTGQLWRLDGHDRAVTRLTGEVTVANGLAFSAAGDRMFWACSREGQVWAFDYDRDTGTPRNRRPWLGLDAPGRPDGAAVDSEDCYWSARWMGGCVARFTPDGRLDRLVRVPASRVTMCAFGGPDLRTLFITTARGGMTPEELAREPLAGGLFAARVEMPGLPEPRFAG